MSQGLWLKFTLFGKMKA